MTIFLSNAQPQEQFLLWKLRSRTMNRRTLTLVVLAPLFFWSSASVQACSPLPDTKFATIEQTTQDAPFVVKAVPREYIGNGTYRVQISEWLKGTGSSEILVAGFANREGVMSSCDRDLRLGEAVLLFVAPQSPDRYTIGFAPGPASPARGMWIDRVPPATPSNADAVRKAVDGARN